GLKDACVENGSRPGATCLNVGGIPSRALVQSSEKFAEARHGLEAHGVKLGAVELDLGAMMARKDKVVDGLTKGIEFLFKKNKVDRVQGVGRITAKGEVTVDGKTKLQTRNIVIATGSDVMPLNGVAVDEKRIVSSTGALSLAKVPASMAVIGGGYIGLEMGSVWSRLGAKVTVVEFLDRIVPGMDGEIGRQLQRILTKQGLSFKLSTKVTGAKAGTDGVTLTLEPAKGGEAETLEAEVVL